MKPTYIMFITIAVTLCTFTSCKKLVEIPQPQNTITAAKVFNSDAEATSAVAGIYYLMDKPVTLAYSNGLTTLNSGMSADELTARTGSFELLQFQNNNLLPNNSIISSGIWTPAYFNIYQANAIIEGLQNSAGVSAPVSKELTGEAKFVRAFCYFYLVNLFGDVPLVTESDWRKINLLPRAKAADVYSQIIQDLKDAQSNLPSDYSEGGGEKIRANSWAATALLARVYLYLGRWADAETQASAVISSGNFTIMPDLSQVFLKNSEEAIFQLQTPAIAPNAVLEAAKIIPTSKTNPPGYTLTPSQLASFESNDARRQFWVDSSLFQKKWLYYPGKYKVRTADNVTEYNMVLRYAELFLIRAEARANLGSNFNGAADDLNVLRNRAGLSTLPYSLTQTEMLAAVAKERRAELFAEWGHRWLDLKRTGQADAVLGGLKSLWKPDAKLWPIPKSELLADPNLKQNPGYQ